MKAYKVYQIDAEAEAAIDIFEEEINRIADEMGIKFTSKDYIRLEAFYNYDDLDVKRISSVVKYIL